MNVSYITRVTQRETISYGENSLPPFRQKLPRDEHCCWANIAFSPLKTLGKGTKYCMKQALKGLWLKLLTWPSLLLPTKVKCCPVLRFCGERVFMEYNLSGEYRKGKEVNGSRAGVGTSIFPFRNKGERQQSYNYVHFQFISRISGNFI